jgi:glutamine synthetase
MESNELNKPVKFSSREEIMEFVDRHNIVMVNFMYPAGDGRLKTLNFSVYDREYLYTILTTGERVDGSSLFNFISGANSDLYVLPRYSTAFVDPFAPVPTLTMLCSFFDKDGNKLAESPEATLHRACKAFTDTTGLQFQAMGELEFYVVSDAINDFPAVDQHGYHESAPFAKHNDFRVRCMDMITRAGGKIKYGHCEVGNFTLDGKLYEQNEIEFLPVPAEDAADQLMLAKWIIRNQAMREGLDVSFAPKITTGKAGSGLHIHMRLMRDGRNIMLNNDLRLSDDARRLIAGLMEMAPSITAFGNTTPTSYFRLVPHQEAPTNVCWGDRNRSALVRVPLGWSTHTDMSALANPGVAPVEVDPTAKQTIEIRSADGSADIYLLLASLAVAARRGFEMGDKALLLAERTYVSVNIHDAANADRLEQLDSLPVDCAESSVRLDEARDIYEADGVFSPAMIDAQIAKLRNYEATDSLHMKQLVEEYFHCG